MNCEEGTMDVDSFLAGRPALGILLTAEQVPPSTCYGCPMAQPVNEGTFSCRLLGRDVWGEAPPCQLTDWQARARQELTER
jgi:hypothetical protein